MGGVLYLIFFKFIFQIRSKHHILDFVKQKVYLIE
jgi:hypothetical protein